MSPIVDQIIRLADSESDLAGFYRQASQVIADAVDAQAVVVWDCELPPFRTIIQLNRQTSHPIKVGVSQVRHLDLLTQATKSNQATIADLEPVGEQTNTVTAEHSVIVFCRVQRGKKFDLFEVFLQPGSAPSVYQKAKATLRDGCEAITEALATNTFSENPLKHQDLHKAPERAKVDEQAIRKLDHFASNIHTSIDLRETAFHIANESQSVLECDRVTVMQFDRKCKTMAISGLPKFNRRANAISALEKLATATLKTGQPFWYPDRSTPQLPQITEPLDRYLTEGVTRSLVIMPLFENQQATRLSPEEIQYSPKNTVIGGVIYENFSGEWQREKMSQPLTTVTRHASTAFRNAYAHQNLFLYSVWRLLGKSKTLTRPKYLPKTLMVLALVTAVIASLFFVPTRMTISGDGELVPVERRNVFAQIDGQVIDVQAEHGSHVKTGQVLVTMISSNLQIQMNEVVNKIALTKKQIEALDNRRLANVTRNQPAAEIAQEDLERTTLLKQLESFEIERDVYVREVAQLNIASPITGQVISDNIKQQLLDRPVRAGQVIVEVAKTDGEWIIEMDLPDRRIGHLLRAQQDSDEPLKATYILTADPGRKLTGTVFDVALSTQVTHDAGQTIRVKVRLDDPGDIDIRQVRTSAVVKIDCGKCSLGYSLFRDLHEFLQTNVFFHFQ